MRKKIILFLIIFAVILGVLGFWYYQRNVYSKSVLKLEILGLDQADLGDEVEYIVKYKNNGNFILEEPKLIFEYPQYSIVEGDNFLRKEIILESIYPGQEKTYSFKARLFGKENETKVAKAWLNFKPKNLSARYEVSTTFTTIIKKVPITFGFDIPSKIESGKTINFNLNYFSNADYPLSNLMVKVEYPSDFEFNNSNPTSLDQTTWQIPLLNKADGGRIEISGVLRGDVGGQKIFKANLGIIENGEFVLIKDTTKGVEIAQPNIFISEMINGNPQYVANLGDNLHYEIFFKNLSQEAMTDLFLVVNLDGKAFDLESLRSDLGDSKTGDNSVVFDWKKVSKLQLLLPQEEGKIDFWVKLKNDLPFTSSQDKNPVVKNRIYISQVQEEFTTKINSKLEISQKGYSQFEGFENTGPTPPQTGQTTTYTIVWEVNNYYNDLKNVKVKAVLPSQVRLTGKIIPEDSKLTFDSQSREIVWEIGDLGVGAGILNQAPKVAFQIAFTPGFFPGNQPSQLVGQATITAEDSWTLAQIENTAPAIDTSLESSPTGEE
jgi:hypothetical protein